MMYENILKDYTQRAYQNYQKNKDGSRADARNHSSILSSFFSRMEMSCTYTSGGHSRSSSFPTQ